MDYRISGERLKGFAEQARRLGKVSGELTPVQIEEVLRGVTAGAALPSIHPLLIAVDVKPTVLPKFAINDLNIVVDASPDVFAKAEDTTPPPPPKYSYNGVVLPEIPADVLASYPYVWIRNDVANSKYDMVFSDTPWFYNGSGLNDSTSGDIPYYSINFTGYENATEWKYADKSHNTFGLSSNRIVLWSNHDIPKGSADATEIYFEGSEPVLAE